MMLLIITKLENLYSKFVRSGANLNKADQDSLKV